MTIDMLYLVLDWRDPECRPDVMGIFTDLHMAMEAARLCTVGLSKYPWNYMPPQGGEVLRLERADHIILIEAIKPTCRPDHRLMDYAKPGPSPIDAWIGKEQT
jgi:hypothetical protein